MRFNAFPLNTVTVDGSESSTPTDATANLVGVAATGAVGVLSTALQLTLASVASQTALGALAATSATNLTLAGVSSGGQVGALASSSGVTLQGSASEGQVGSVSVTVSVSEIALEGVGSAGGVGALSVSVSEEPETFGLDGVSAGVLIEFDRSYREHGAVVLKGLSSTCGLGALRTEVEFAPLALPAKSLIKVAQTLKSESASLSLVGLQAFALPPVAARLCEPVLVVDEELEELAMLVAAL